MQSHRTDPGSAGPDEATGRRSGLVVAVAALVLLGGVAERWILYVQDGRTNSDEALSGLMARQLLHGHPSLFLWGQNQGGTLEVFPVAAATRLLGSSLLVERLTTLILSALCALLVGTVVDRLSGRWAALAAGAVVWLWPTYFVQWSSQEYLYYVPVVALSLGAAVLAVRSARRPAGVGAPVVIGVLLGLAWWTSPNMAVFVPLVVGLALRAGAHRVRRVALATVGAIVGAAPWLVFNVRHHLASLDVGNLSSHGTYRNRLGELLHVGLPLALGLRRTDTSWVGPWAHGVYLACLALGAAVTVRTLVQWARHRTPFPADLLAVALYPFIYAASPVVSTTADFIPRYFFFAWPFVALVVGRSVATVSGGDLRDTGAAAGPGRHRAPVHRLPPARAVTSAALVSAGAVGLLGVAVVQAARLPPPFVPPPGLTAAQNDLHVAAASLEAHGVDRVFTSYWTAYVLDQVADGRVIATPAASSVARYKPWDRDVRSNPDPAWVLVPGSIKATTLLGWLAAHHMGYRTFAAAGYQVIEPAQRVLPEELPVAVSVNPSEGV